LVALVRGLNTSHLAGERMIKSPPIDHIPRGLRRPERRLQ
jgi:hypothetical protein